MNTPNRLPQSPRQTSWLLIQGLPSAQTTPRKTTGPEEYGNLAESAQDTIAERQQEAHQKEARPEWPDALAVSTALFAVLAAFASPKAGDSANEALRANQAVLPQTQAVDTWSQFQADCIKKYQALSLIAVLPHVGGSAAELQAAKGQVAARQKTQDALLVEAKQRDAETARLSKESEGLLARHTTYALSVTLLQVAIGLAAIATLLRRPLWWLSLGVGGVAAVALLVGLL